MKKKKGGRPREAIRTRVRDGRVSFAVCENERAAIQIKYKLSLKCAADYCREDEAGGRDIPECADKKK